MPFIETTNFANSAVTICRFESTFRLISPGRDYRASAWAANNKASVRLAVLSTRACDFSPLHAVKNSLGVPARFVDVFSFTFLYTGERATPQAVALIAGHTYYINVRNKRSNGDAGCTYDDCPLVGGVPK